VAARLLADKYTCTRIASVLYYQPSSKQGRETVTKDEVMTVARKYDADACWASDDADDNCLLVASSAVVFLLDREPSAWEDPNPPGSTPDHTRVVFPNL
jgi:hypothetical protein